MPGVFATVELPQHYDVLAPDGSEGRILSRLAGGSMAHFRLRPGQVSRAVRHRTVEEIWFVLEGKGELWRSMSGQEAITALSPGVSLAIPVGAAFQFRALGDHPLAIIATTMPPWPGEDEAMTAAGKWDPSV